MPLLDFEIAMGTLIRGGSAAPLPPLHLNGAEVSCLEALKASAGFEFTVGVQRSWCEGRAKRAGSFTLAVLSEDRRRRLLSEWVETGGGTSSFFAAESEAFLEFIAGRLPDPSHELTACRFEQATLRANQGSSDFHSPEAEILSAAGCALRRGRYAAMVPSPVATDATNLLFGPGLERLYRVATPREAELWRRLRETTPVGGLLTEGYSRDDLAPLLQEGIVECTAVPNFAEAGLSG